MPATLASIDPIMKEVYAPRIREQLNTETVGLKRIQRSSAGVSTDIGGKYVTFPIHIRRNSGVGSRRENEPLPLPGQQGYAAARIGLKYAYGSIKLTGQTLALANKDAQAFAKALDQEVTGVKDDVLKDMNRKVYGTGNGAISTIKTTTASGTVWPVTDGRLFQEGEVIDLITLPSTVAQAGNVVQAIDLTPGANTITVSTASAVTAGQIITRAGSGPDASGNRELTGLGAIINNTGTLYNVDPTVVGQWKAVNFNNGGTNRALSEGLMQQVVDQIRTNGGKVSLMLTSLGVRRSYANLLTQTRSSVNTTDFKGGFSGLAFTTDTGDLPLVSDPDAPLNKILFVSEDHITYYHDEDWHWLDQDGSMWERYIDSNGVYDAWFANLVEYQELGTDRRNTHGVLADVTES